LSLNDIPGSHRDPLSFEEQSSSECNPWMPAAHPKSALYFFDLKTVRVSVTLEIKTPRQETHRQFSSLNRSVRIRSHRGRAILLPRARLRAAPSVSSFLQQKVCYLALGSVSHQLLLHA